MFAILLGGCNNVLLDLNIDQITIRLVPQSLEYVSCLTTSMA